LTLAAWLGSGCAEPIAGLIHPNQRPSVEFTHAPVGADPGNPDFYAYRVYWADALPRPTVHTAIWVSMDMAG